MDLCEGLTLCCFLTNTGYCDFRGRYGGVDNCGKDQGTFPDKERTGDHPHMLQTAAPQKETEAMVFWSVIPVVCGDDLEGGEEEMLPRK